MTLVAMAASPAMAQLNPLMNACRVIEEDERRLACYDRNANRSIEGPTNRTDGGGTANVTVAPATKPKPAWIVQTDQSPLTDERSVYLSVRSENDVRCRFGHGQPLTLLVQCFENTTSLYIQSHCFVADIQGYGDVDVRLDDEPMRTIAMRESTNNRALGLWRGNRSIPVVRSMFGKERLIARLTPFNDSPVTATFPITGLETAIEPLRKACNW